MGYVTDTTEWPENGVPKSVKDFVDRFFSTMDNNTSSGGDILADEICAPDCEMLLAGNTFKGIERWSIVRTKIVPFNVLINNRDPAKSRQCLEYYQDTETQSP